MFLEIIFSNNKYVINVRMYYVENIKYFGYLLLEDIGTVIDPHR